MHSPRRRLSSSIPLPHSVVAFATATLVACALAAPAGRAAAAPPTAAATAAAAHSSAAHPRAGDRPATADDIRGLDGADSVYLRRRSTAVAPGLDLTSFQRLQPGGWVTGRVMTADLDTPSLSLGLSDGGAVSGANAPVSEFADQPQVVAAVNGDYYDMNASDAPVGTDIADGTVHNAGATARQAFTVSDGKAAIRELMSAATLRADGVTTKIAAVNSPTFQAGSVGLFTLLWGRYPIGRLLTANEPVRVVTVVNSTVTAVSDERSALEEPADIPSGSSLLVARGAGTKRLASLAVGTHVELTVKASAPVDLAIGGSQRLLTDGRKTTEDQVTAARTAIGISKDGSRLWVVSLDGRQGDSHGMTIQELTDFLADLGAWNAINLDGGGSTTMVARPAGASGLSVVGRPSDGAERHVSNALVFRSTASGPSTSVVVRPVLQPAAGLPADGANDTLIGLSRTVHGTRLAADLSPAPGGGHFTATPGRVLQTVAGDPTSTVVRGRTTGSATVTFRAGRHHAAIPITVHGRVARLTPSSAVMSIPSHGKSRTLTLTASDADGFTVPVETRDVRVRAGEGVRVTADGPSGFTVTPNAGKLSSSITFTVAGHDLTVPVTVGYDEKTLADFTDASSWTFAADRATGSVTPVDGPGGDTGAPRGLGLDFDFSTTTATRGAYAVPPAPLPVPGQPQALALWIKGTGKGEWPRLMITKGDGTSTNLDPEQGASNPIVTWNGWQQVRFPVPTGTPYPITLTKIRFMETRSDASYTDQLAVAGLTAQVPPAVTLPDTPWPTDPAVVAAGATDHSPQRIAVMSDTQFVARDPDSPIVAAGRRALREIVAAHPDLLVIDGDFVDEGSPADIAFAKQVLDEEVGDRVPYVYVPGNHEVMGGPISNFQNVFGATSTHRDLGRTRIITLDSSSGTLHPGGSTEQLRMLQEQLADAARNPRITGVLVFNHHPVDDPQPDKASQLGDRYEAAALRRTLAHFTATSGKSIAQVNGHVGIFFTDAADGVTRIINGNSGKTPSGSPEQGGFTGWTMLGIDPGAGVVGTVPRTGARLPWLRDETHARVDALNLSAPSQLAVGASGEATATISQDQTRTVPVAWPVSAAWGGDGVRIGDAHGRAVVAFDPASGKLTGIRRGTATLTVTVNGVTKRATIEVG
ncbi:phosphodiester glycosidase family protein [Flexivirga sp.]|uniref:phosphodiester glycosidase family protein n=1 Tax=Flexivirga sp. TaxID=1962927 RepID=UPI003F8073DD